MDRPFDSYTYIYILQVKGLPNVEYIMEDTVVRTYRHETDSWALDRIDQREGDLNGIYNPGPGRDGEGVEVYVLDTGWTAN